MRYRDARLVSPDRIKTAFSGSLAGGVGAVCPIAAHGRSVLTDHPSPKSWPLVNGNTRQMDDAIQRLRCGQQHSKRRAGHGVVAIKWFARADAPAQWITAAISNRIGSRAVCGSERSAAQSMPGPGASHAPQPVCHGAEQIGHMPSDQAGRAGHQDRLDHARHASNGTG